MPIEEPIPCPHCGVEIKPSRLNRHLIKTHNNNKNDSEKIVTCKICGLNMINRLLKSHEDKEHNFKRYRALIGSEFVISRVERECSCCKKSSAGTMAYLNTSIYICKKCKSVIKKRNSGKSFDMMNIAVRGFV